MPTFRNFYQRYRCNHLWEDVWSATCNDDCPRRHAVIAVPTNRTMRMTNNSQPFGAVFLFRRQRGRPAEVVLRT
jgi:hypothetical protein